MSETNRNVAQQRHTADSAERRPLMPDVSHRMMRFPVASAVLVMWAVSVLAADGLLQQIEGAYEIPSQCTAVTAKGHEPCGPHVHDRLQITKVSDCEASVKLYSVQINGYQCEVAGVAELQGDSSKLEIPVRA